MRRDRPTAGNRLRVEHPPEDWLEKVYDGDALVDLIFQPETAPTGR